MKKVLNCFFEFDTDVERSDVLTSINKTMVTQRTSRATIKEHDCYHDERKPCKNEVIIYDDINSTPDNINLKQRYSKE